MKFLKNLLLFLFLVSFHFIINAQQEIQLRWNPSTDNVGVTGYNVWLDGEYYGSTSDTTFVFSLDPGIYAMGVSAYDAAGNESAMSEVLMVEIEDRTSPTIPDSLMIVYPNPTYGTFMVKFGKEIKDNSVIQIITAAGRLEYQRAIPSADIFYEEEFNLEGVLAPGIYIVALIENNVRKGHTYIVISARIKHKQV